MHCPGCDYVNNQMHNEALDTYTHCPGVLCTTCAEREREHAKWGVYPCEQCAQKNQEITEKDAEIARLKFCVEADEYADRLYKQSMEIAALEAQLAAVTKEQDTLRARCAALERVVEALDRCEGKRGRFSTVPLHDCRCEKDRGISETCTCGSDELRDALAALECLQ